MHPVHLNSPRLHVPMGVDQVAPPLLHVVLMFPVKPEVQLVRHTEPGASSLQLDGNAELLVGAGGNVPLQTAPDGRARIRTRAHEQGCRQAGRRQQ